MQNILVRKIPLIKHIKFLQVLPTPNSQPVLAVVTAASSDGGRIGLASAATVAAADALREGGSACWEGSRGGSGGAGGTLPAVPESVWSIAKTSPPPLA